MPRWNTVAIVGVGLLGGSIGLGLRQRGVAKRIVGIGRRRPSLEIARRVGAITASTTNLERGVQDADIVVVCTPVEQIPQYVQAAASHCSAGCLITDVGSTKQRIVSQLDGGLPPGVCFVGSHPLAGSEKRGVTEASADLLEGRVVVLTPVRATSPATRRTATAFWQSLGARVVEMTPAHHDQALAFTSHLPHAVAVALAQTVPAADLALAAGGLRDTTRIAAGDVEIWTQILLDNRENVSQALERFDAAVTELRQALAAGDRRQLKRILTQAKRKRDALGS
ncbi:MAG: prephenate dehydrogenase [Pirellulales bacterium]